MTVSNDHDSGRRPDDATRLDDPTLLECLRAGEESAFEIVYDACAASLLRFAYSYVRSTTVAQDVVADTFAHLYQNVVRAAAQSDALSLGLPIAADRPSTTTYTFDLAALTRGILSMQDPHVMATLDGTPIEDAIRECDNWRAQYPNPSDWMVHRARLRVVAFVQDLETSDVLQAAVVQVPSDSAVHP
jgi:hypothetical protein